MEIWNRDLRSGLLQPLPSAAWRYIDQGIDCPACGWFVSQLSSLDSLISVFPEVWVGRARYRAFVSRLWSFDRTSTNGGHGRLDGQDVRSVFFQLRAAEPGLGCCVPISVISKSVVDRPLVTAQPERASRRRSGAIGGTSGVQRRSNTRRSLEKHRMASESSRGRMLDVNVSPRAQMPYRKLFVRKRNLWQRQACGC